MKKERQYISKVHEKLPKDIYKWNINDFYAGGVPDAFYRKLNHSGVPLWVEYKLIKTLPKRDNTLVKPDLSSQQLIWLNQAISSNEKALVIIGVENEKQTTIGKLGLILGPHEWEHGIPKVEAEKRLLCYQQVADYINLITSNYIAEK